MPTELELFTRFGIALFIGFLIGLEREYAAKDRDRTLMAGVRTHSLLGITGAVAALVGQQINSEWGFIAVTLVTGSLIIVGYGVEAAHGERGLTSEVAALLSYFSGALCYWNQIPLAVALGVTTMGLLSLKPEMHTFAHRLTREDVYATLKFAVISAIVLPVLPNQAIGPAPWDALNPYAIWRMAVLISGLSFIGYALMKVIKSEQAISLTGLLGGLVSSTAVTLSFTQRSREREELSRAFAMGVFLAWTVMFARVLVIVGLLYAPLLKELWPPLGAGMGFGLLYSFYLYQMQRRAETTQEIALSNPFKLGPAFQFALIYAVILLIARSAQLYVGAAGLYLSSALAGLTTVDAITLSLTELVRAGHLAPEIAAQGIILAALVNTLLKGGLVWTSGSPALRKALLPGLGLLLIVTIAAVALG